MVTKACVIYMKDTSSFGKLLEVCISNIGKSKLLRGPLYAQCPALKPFFDHLEERWIHWKLDSKLKIERFIGDNNGPVDFLLVDKKDLSVKSNITPWSSSKIAPNASKTFKPQCSYLFFWKDVMKRDEAFDYDLHKCEIMKFMVENCGRMCHELIKLFFAHDHLVYLQAHDGKLLISYPDPFATSKEVQLAPGGTFFVHTARGKSVSDLINNQSSMTIKYRTPQGKVLSIANFQVHSLKAGKSDSHQINMRLMGKSVFDLVENRVIRNINCSTFDLGYKIVVKANKELCDVTSVADMFNHMSISH